MFIVERTAKPVKPVKWQAYTDAPVGSIAYCAQYDFKWLKTADNEWSIFSSDNVTIAGKDRTDETVWGEEGYSTLTTFPGN